MGGGSGSVAVEDFISLRDPDGLVPFPIRNDGTPERLLTGADFDPSRFAATRAATCGSATSSGPSSCTPTPPGALEQAPIPLPGVTSPEDPTRPPGEPSTLGRSDGFEGDGPVHRDPERAACPPGAGAPEVLHPVLEDALLADPDKRRRYVYAFHLAQGAYGPERWEYRTESSAHRVADVASVDANHAARARARQPQGETPRSSSASTWSTCARSTPGDSSSSARWSTS